MEIELDKKSNTIYLSANLDNLFFIFITLFAVIGFILVINQPSLDLLDISFAIFLALFILLFGVPEILDNIFWLFYTYDHKNNCIYTGRSFLSKARQISNTYELDGISNLSIEKYKRYSSAEFETGSPSAMAKMMLNYIQGDPVSIYENNETVTKKFAKLLMQLLDVKLKENIFDDT
jgi:hypothetical protein